MVGLRQAEGVGTPCSALIWVPTNVVSGYQCRVVALGRAFAGFGGFYVSLLFVSSFSLLSLSFLWLGEDQRGWIWYHRCGFHSSPKTRVLLFLRSFKSLADLRMGI